MSGPSDPFPVLTMAVVVALYYAVKLAAAGARRAAARRRAARRRVLALAYVAHELHQIANGGLLSPPLRAAHSELLVREWERHGLIVGGR